ncbi:hypothetical protein SSX86_028452 [Deinandra increscens subsp. villosa]|uniref:Uncharacterized protein n=1 Tax=Deinandra increscens subsp. villosa TaxID=3103831 RepID=A0AAP0GKV1_9ASTR
MLHLAASSTTMFQEKKEGEPAALVKIGTRGTVGNLLMKEIEYYKRLESQIGSDPEKKHGGSGGGSRYWWGFGLFSSKWQRIKSNYGSRYKFWPRFRMTLDAVECQHHHANKIPGFDYHKLEADTKQYRIW